MKSLTLLALLFSFSSINAFAKFNPDTGSAQAGDLYCVSNDVNSNNLLVISDDATGEPTQMELIKSGCGVWYTLASARILRIEAANSVGGPGTSSMIYSGQGFEVSLNKKSFQGEITQSASLEIDLEAGALSESFNCSTVK